MKKFTDYCIIDHVGSVTGDIKKAYTMAYSLADRSKVYTMKKFCNALSHKPEQAEVSDKQKWFVRLNKSPEQVILVCEDADATSVKNICDIWAEKVNDLKVIEASEAGFAIHEFHELYPHLFAERGDDDSRYRRCANIWSDALGWKFSAPLYRDANMSNSEIESFMARPDRAKMIELQHGDTTHISKPASKPESYINAHSVANTQEIMEFWNFYKAVKVSNLIETVLEIDYTLCPECGRPIRNNGNCKSCTYEHEEETAESFFDDNEKYTNHMDHSFYGFSFDAVDEYLDCISIEDKGLAAFAKTKLSKAAKDYMMFRESDETDWITTLI